MGKDEVFDYIDVFVRRGPYQIHVTQKYYRDAGDGHCLYVITRGRHIVFVDQSFQLHQGRIDKAFAVAELADYLEGV
jgi:hypothetical protein